MSKQFACNFALVSGLVFAFGCAHSTNNRGVAEDEATRLPLYIISDVDDTVRVTHVNSKAAALGRVLFTERLFGGMGELYTEMLKAQAPNETGASLHFVSGAPNTLMKSNVQKTLEGGTFPKFDLSLRSVRVYKFDEDGTRRFKKNKIVELTKAQPMRSYVLFGDDTEVDPQAFTEFQKENPAAKIQTIYIHRFKKISPDLPEGVIPYYTSFDVALREYRQGRLSEDQVRTVAKAVLATTPKNLFHEDSSCPTKGDPGFIWEGEEGSLRDLQREVVDYVLKACDTVKE